MSALFNYFRIVCKSKTILIECISFYCLFVLFQLMVQCLVRKDENHKHKQFMRVIFHAESTNPKYRKLFEVIRKCQQLLIVDIDDSQQNHYVDCVPSSHALFFSFFKYSCLGNSCMFLLANN